MRDADDARLLLSVPSGENLTRTENGPIFYACDTGISRRYASTVGFSARVSKPRSIDRRLVVIPLVQRARDIICSSLLPSRARWKMRQSSLAIYSRRSTNSRFRSLRMPGKIVQFGKNLLSKATMTIVLRKKQRWTEARDCFFTGENRPPRSVDKSSCATPERRNVFGLWNGNERVKFRGYRARAPVLFPTATVGSIYGDVAEREPWSARTRFVPSPANFCPGHRRLVRCPAC